MCAKEHFPFLMLLLKWTIRFLKFERDLRAFQAVSHSYRLLCILEFACVSVCVSRRHTGIFAYIDVRCHTQAYSYSGKVFGCFQAHASFPNECNYAKTN